MLEEKQKRNLLSSSHSRSQKCPFATLKKISFLFKTPPLSLSPFLFSIPVSNPFSLNLMKAASTAMFKHHTLLQDYHHLHKETEVVKETLDRAKQKKLTLQAEVRFLRRRYKYLTRKQSQNPQPQKHDARRRNNVQERKHIRKGAALQSPVLGIDLNQKGKDCNVKQAYSASGSGRNLKGRTSRGNEAVFDLNQISREEEEEELKGAMERSIRVVSEEKESDMKLSGCRNGKRKITWQDQVALRV